jgi:2-polyprenyl-3-methyl-5-hydroxy-6-metoxy-1,4-benzoquinol methylase
MLNLTTRSLSKELLDADNIPFKDIERNMKELNTINTLLGGHKITTSALKNFTIQTNTTICEVGCGGGDNLKAIQKKYPTLNFIGIDIKASCTSFAAKQYGALAKWITEDYKQLNFENNKPDIIFSSLLCHHFTNNELIDLLKWKYENCEQGFFINDLQRNSLAYFLIKILTKLFSKSYLVKNDAPLSVARGFHKKEWELLLQQANIKNYSIQWKWAFRYLIICNK